MKKILTLALALAPFPGFADDKSADARQLSPASRAERLSDAQLDQVTAGNATTLLVVLNPGNKGLLNVHNGHTVLINFFGGVPPGDTSRSLLVVNPARTIQQPKP